MDNLEKVSKQVRIDIVDMIHNAGSGHPGGSLSCTDILVAIYFSGKCNLNKNNIASKDRDRVVLSKGHASSALYAILANAGYIDKEDLKTYRKIDGHLEGHPVRKVNGVEVCTGSLGQGLSFANGMALASKLDDIPYNVYCIMGDGELEEGQVWEAAMSSSEKGLNNVVAFIDYNGLQIDGKLSEVKSAESIQAKFLAFNWNVINVDGHDIKMICDAIDKAKESDKPTCIICKTVKGKGISFMENNVDWHGKSINDDEYELAKRELEG